jgi:hypothetical protein
MKLRGRPKKRLEVGLVLQMLFELRLVFAGQPTDDLVDLRLGPPFLLGFREVVRVNTRKAHRVGSMRSHEWKNRSQGMDIK